MNYRIIIIAASILIVATLSLWPRGTLLRRLENIVSRQPSSKAAGGVYATTDRYLSPLHLTNPSEAILIAMADVPPEDAMVFITPNADEESELIYRTVAYLGWPRPIGEARRRKAGEAPELLFQPPSERPIKWLLFYRLRAPADLAQTSRMIGPHLALARLPELKEWKSYCSQ